MTLMQSPDSTAMAQPSRLAKQRELLWQLVRRDLHGRYRGSILGIFWVLLTPLLMLAVYTFVFGVVFEARWGSAASDDPRSTVQFAFVLYSGLMLHGFMAEVWTRSTALIVHHTNYVKKVMFPLALLPIQVTITAGILLAVQWGILLTAMLLCGQSIPLTALWVPLILAPLGLLVLAGAWFLAAIGVYVRDLEQLMGLAMTLLLFLSPIFYPVSALPESFQSLILLNPLTLIIENVRAVLFHAQPPNFSALAVFGALSLLCCVLSFRIFRYLRGGFSDVL